MEIMTWKDAATRRLAKYFTGKPCIRGHLVQRYVSSKACIACIAGYGRKNREFVKAQTQPQVSHISVTLLDTQDIPALLQFAESLNTARELERLCDGSYYADRGIPTSRQQD